MQSMSNRNVAVSAHYRVDGTGKSLGILVSCKEF